MANKCAAWPMLIRAAGLLLLHFAIANPAVADARGKAVPPPAAPAINPSAPTARALFDQGQAAYDKEDYKNAVRYMRLACDRDFATACYNLALMHANGKAGAVDFSVAARFYEMGCKFGDEQACNNLGVLYQNGRGVAQDAPSAIRYYRRSCTINASLGCANLSAMLDQGLDESKPSMDPRWVEIAALNKRACIGHPHGCLRYGFNLTTGLGVVRDDAAAARQFVTACEAKISSGCFNLGAAYEEAKGVRRDAALSARYYEWACELGNAEGCYSSGLAMMRKGKALAFAAQALPRFTSACAGGVGEKSAGGDPVPAACASAAYLLAGLQAPDLQAAGDTVTGQTMPVDRTKARDLARQGCAAANEEACALVPLLADGADKAPEYRRRMDRLARKIFGG